MAYKPHIEVYKPRRSVTAFAIDSAIQRALHKQKRLQRQIEHAYADGNSDSDFIEGRLVEVASAIRVLKKLKKELNL